MTGTLTEAEKHRRALRRLTTRVADTYARSALGGFLYLIALPPLIYVTDMYRRHALATALIALSLLLAGIVRWRMSPPSDMADAVVQQRWVVRYSLVALSSTLLWTIIQAWILLDHEIDPLLKCVSLFGTLAFSTVLGHLYTSMLRFSISGILIMFVPTLVLLWLDPQMRVPAVAMVFYALYLTSATLRSHKDYKRRLDLDEALRNQRDKYELLSRTDALTGLCNRRTFTETLNAQVREAQWLEGAGVSLALLDIDHFKAINDRHGHVIGDEVLRHLARRLETAFGGSDVMVARTGGEEFGLVLRDVDEISAMIRVEAFREALQGKPIVCAGLEVPVTVSIGVGRFDAASHRDDDGLYGAVDVAMYAAKQQGRNCVVSISMLASTAPADRLKLAIPPPPLAQARGSAIDD